MDIMKNCMRITGCSLACLLYLSLNAGTIHAQEINDAVFMHHSCGANWLSNSLNAALTAKDYIDERNDIYYGTTMSQDAGRPASLGSTPGDNTNMNHWILWFNDYLDHIRVHACANGYNRIVMFKSCYPISHIGSDGAEPGSPFSGTQSLVNYKSVYRHPSGPGNTYSNGGYTYKPLEDIFAENPDVLFIPVTAPPLHYGPSDATNDAAAHRARLFNNWLKNEWLAGYEAAHPSLDNVAVFDWFDFLAYPDDHAAHPNRLREEYGGNNGDSHPNSTANAASTVSFATSTDNFLDRAWTAFNTNSVELQVMILLQGPYDAVTHEMSCNLQQNGHIPATAPYAENARTISAVPANITDWLLVQLRSTAAGAAVASYSVLLHNKGSLIADLGTTARFAMDAADGDYFVVLKHRNHGAVMTQAAVSLARGSSTLYNFTANSSQFYGANGATELESGVWGMWAGDINQDGLATTPDYVQWYNSGFAGEAGYRPADLNQDTIVDDGDFRLWRNAAAVGRSCSLP